MFFSMCLEDCRPRKKLRLVNQIGTLRTKDGSTKSITKVNTVNYEICIFNHSWFWDGWHSRVRSCARYEPFINDLRFNGVKNGIKSTCLCGISGFSRQMSCD